MKHLLRHSSIHWRQLGCAVGLLAATQVRSDAVDTDESASTTSNSGPVELKLGPFEFEPQAVTKFTYDDNIVFSSKNPITDTFWDINPGFQAVAGDKLSLLAFRNSGANVMNISPDSLVTSAPENWPGEFVIMDETPQFEWYTQQHQNDYIGNVARINTLFPKNKCILGASFSYSDTPITVVETTQRSTSQNLSVSGSAAYFISDKTSVNTILSYSDVAYQSSDLIGYKEWRDSSWLNYQLTALFNVSSGITVGLDDAAVGSGQKFAQLLVRGRYQYAAKLAFNGSVGGELRQYDSGAPDAYDPVFDFGALYSIGERTRLGLNGSRSTTAAAIGGSGYTVTGANLSLDQGFSDRFGCNFKAGYELFNPVASSGSASSTANSAVDFYSFNASFGFKLTHQLKGEVFYTYRLRLEQSNADVSGNQVGLQLSWQL